MIEEKYNFGSPFHKNNNIEDENSNNGKKPVEYLVDDEKERELKKLSGFLNGKLLESEESNVAKSINTSKEKRDIVDIMIDCEDAILFDSLHSMYSTMQRNYTKESTTSTNLSNIGYIIFGVLLTIIIIVYFLIVK